MALWTGFLIINQICVFVYICANVAIETYFARYTTNFPPYVLSFARFMSIWPLYMFPLFILFAHQTGISIKLIYAAIFIIRMGIIAVYSVKIFAAATAFVNSSMPTTRPAAPNVSPQFDISMAINQFTLRRTSDNQSPLNLRPFTINDTYATEDDIDKSRDMLAYYVYKEEIIESDKDPINEEIQQNEDESYAKIQKRVARFNKDSDDLIAEWVARCTELKK